MIETITNQDLLDPALTDMMQRGKTLPRVGVRLVNEENYQRMVSAKKDLDESRADYVELAEQMDRKAAAVRISKVKSAVCCAIITAAILAGVAADIVNAVYGCAIAGVCCMLEAWCWRGCKDV